MTAHTPAHDTEYDGALAYGRVIDREFVKQCAELGLDPEQAIQAPLASIIVAQTGPVEKPQQHQPGWSEHTESKLRYLWTRGFSAGEIEARLDHQWSRSAILAKAHRLGLESRMPPKGVAA